MSNIPSFINATVISKDGKWSDTWSLIMQQLLSQLINAIGSNGFQVSVLSSEPTAQFPLGQIAAIEDSALPGTIVFDTYAQAQNGQLLLRMNDGTFHGITNT